jgi:phosphatidylinositol alpha 1,6-mannosyltransferase
VRKAAVRLEIPVVANYQTDVSGFIDFYGLNTAKTIVEKRLKKVHKGSTLTLAPSTDSIAFLNSLGIENVHYWGRGVDLEQFNPKWRSEKLRKYWGAESETLVIGFVGRLAPEKQVHKLASIGDVGLLAGKKILQVIVGDGPTRESLEKSLPKAIFTGHLSGKELSKAVASMDLLVTTGEHETFCQVIQEAMAAGLAVIAPNAGGPKDLIVDGEDGFLYEPGDNLDIRKKVLRAIFDREQLNQMSDAAFTKVQGKTWEQICSELVLIFSDVIEEERPTKADGLQAS